jgi:translation initiation factor IF-2
MSCVKVKVQLISCGVGEITLADIAMAAVRKAWVVAFNVLPTHDAAEHARARGIQVSYYSIIYELLDDLDAKMLKVSFIIIIYYLLFLNLCKPSTVIVF